VILRDFFFSSGGRFQRFNIGSEQSRLKFLATGRRQPSGKGMSGRFICEMALCNDIVRERPEIR